MARSNQYDPKTSEARSSWLSGLAEVCNKITGVLNMDVNTFEDMKMDELFIYADDRCRIYQIGSGLKNWLMTPRPVIKKNGFQIEEDTDMFTIDYLGGSIAFEKDFRLNEVDVITASASYIVDKSQAIANILKDIELLNVQAEQYKGYYDTYNDLMNEQPHAQKGDYALVDADKCFYLWDDKKGKWIPLQLSAEMDNLYTAEEVDKLLEGKQDFIVPFKVEEKGADYYYSGQKNWQNVYLKVLDTILTYLDTSVNEKVTKEDTVLSAIGKLQSQIDNNIGGAIGEGAPTEATEGKLGQDYIDSLTGDKYHLVGLEPQGDGTTKYIWEQYANKSDTPTDVVKVSSGANITMPGSFGEGEYTIELTEEDGSAIDIDDVPTQGSTNAVSSNGVYNALQEKAGMIPPFSVVLVSNGWTDNRQTVSDSRFLSAERFAYLVSYPGSENYEIMRNNNVKAVEKVTTDGQMIFQCDTVPTTDVYVGILRFEAGV